VFQETGLSIEPSSLVELGTRSKDIETKRGMENWTGVLYLCKEFQGKIQRTEKAEEPIWVKITDVLEDKYRMPRMSSDYLSFIMVTLRSQLNNAILSR